MARAVLCGPSLLPHSKSLIEADHGPQHRTHSRAQYELRRNLPSGHAVMTAGIATLGPEAVARIVKTIAVYDDFCHANDPTVNTTLARSKPTASEFFQN